MATTLAVSGTEARPNDRNSYCYDHYCSGQWHNLNWQQHRRERERWRYEHSDAWLHKHPHKEKSNDHQRD